MNTNILQKCIEELKKESPDLSYIKGMLETLVDIGSMPSMPHVPYVSQNMVNPHQVTNTQPVYVSTLPGQTVELTDEEITAQRYAGGPIGQVGTI